MAEPRPADPRLKDTRGIGFTSARTRGRMVERLREQGIRDERVLAAMAEVPRHVFLDEALAHRAYEDDALPIGHGQTISQPWVVARMLELAANGRVPQRALEVGTGCGYQAAVLARIAREAYSIERIRALLDRARSNLLGLKLTNLRLVHGDGHAGLPEAAPFDAILVAAAPPAVPPALLEQLAPGGRLVLPVGPEGDAQSLRVIERRGRGYAEEFLNPVRFVPMRKGTR